MDSIFIWAAKLPGVDPATHFWFERDGVRYRICDGVRWIEGTGSDNRPDFPVPCGLCKETYLEDVLRGVKLLHLLPKPPALDNKIDTTGNGVYASKNEVYPSENTGVAVAVVPKVPVKMFAEFYQARPVKQV